MLLWLNSLALPSPVNHTSIMRVSSSFPLFITFLIHSGTVFWNIITQKGNPPVCAGFPLVFNNKRAQTKLIQNKMQLVSVPNSKVEENNSHRTEPWYFVNSFFVFFSFLLNKVGKLCRATFNWNPFFFASIFLYLFSWTFSLQNSTNSPRLHPSLKWPLIFNGIQ